MADSYIVSSKARIALFYAYLLAIGVLSFFVVRIVLDNAELARQAHRTNCAQKHRLQRSIEETKDVLANPSDPQNQRIILAIGKPILHRSIRAATSDLATYKDVTGC